MHSFGISCFAGGGSYYCDLSHALSTYRIGYSPNEYGDQLGFRIALNTPN